MSCSSLYFKFTSASFEGWHTFLKSFQENPGSVESFGSIVELLFSSLRFPPLSFLPHLFLSLYLIFPVISLFLLQSLHTYLFVQFIPCHACNTVLFSLLFSFSFSLFSPLSSFCCSPPFSYFWLRPSLSLSFLSFCSSLFLFIFFIFLLSCSSALSLLFISFFYLLSSPFSSFYLTLFLLLFLL